MWLKVLGAVIIFIGAIAIFDARRLIKKYFNYGEENIATLGMKIFGLIGVLVGSLIIY